MKIVRYIDRAELWARHEAEPPRWRKFVNGMGVIIFAYIFMMQVIFGVQYFAR